MIVHFISSRLPPATLHTNLMLAIATLLAIVAELLSRPLAFPLWTVDAKAVRCRRSTRGLGQPIGLVATPMTGHSSEAMGVEHARKQP